MKEKILRLKTALKAVMLILMMGVVGISRVFAYSFSAVCETGQTLYYNITDATNHYVALTYPGSYGSWWDGYTKPTGNIIIPETVDYNNETYTITSIGLGAFAGCSDLTGNLSIPNSVVRIDYLAFAESGFISIDISDSVVVIDESAFQSCDNLQSINWGNSVTLIGARAFSRCEGLQTIIIPNSVKTIGMNAFYYCQGLTAIDIPNSVVCIEAEAFSYCGKLAAITIGNGLKSLGPRVFNNTKWYNNQSSGVLYLDGYCLGYKGSSPTGSLVIQNDTKLICDAAFGNCTSLTSVSIPNSVTSIGTSAFYGCSNLSTITIGDLVDFIGSRTFTNTSWYNQQPDGLLYLNNYCLGYKGSEPTGSLSFQNGTRVIAGDAFSNCNDITSVNLPNSVVGIGFLAFSISSCKAVELIIPNSVTYIGWGAFSGWSKLTSMTINAITPPVVVGVSPFSYVNKNIPVNVHCESVTSYQSEYIWNEFTNYHGIDCPIYTVEGYGSGSGKWVFIASPVVEDLNPTAVTNLIGGGTVGNYDYDLFRYNPSAALGWENYVTHTDGFVLQNGKGYLYAREETADIEFIGTLNTGTSKTVALNQGWNLVGNPFVTAVNVNKPFYRMNETGTDIEPVSAYSTTDIPACNGVVVKATGTSGTVTFTQSTSKASSGDNGLQMTLTKTGARGNEIHDKAIVCFNEDAQLEKFVFNEDHAKLYIFQDDEDFAIAFSERKSEIPVHFVAKELGTYTISFSGENMSDIKLVDKLENVIIDLGVNDGYTFIGSPADSRDRFRLVFGDSIISTGLGTEVFAYQNGNEIIINGEGELQVFDVMGRMVATQQINGVQTIAAPQTGVYILRLDGKTQKVVVR